MGAPGIVGTEWGLLGLFGLMEALLVLNVGAREFELTHRIVVCIITFFVPHCQNLRIFSYVNGF
jgi:hypothetical protein